MPNQIHPTAIIHPEALLGNDISVGPYSIIDQNVTIGDGCRIGPGVHLTGHTTIGRENRFHTGCVIGDEPQDLSYRGAPTRLEIGDRNTFREQVTIHRSNKEEESTEIGSENLFMVNSHVGHNAQVGNQNILANGTLIAGHAIIEDRVVFGGNTAVHQFVRVGKLALLQGLCALSQDLPPFMIACNVNELAGMNVIGMKRAEISTDQRSELKRLYHLLFRKGLSLQTAIKQAREQSRGECCQIVLDFIQSSKRGICHRLRS